MQKSPAFLLSDAWMVLRFKNQNRMWLVRVDLTEILKAVSHDLIFINFYLFFGSSYKYLPKLPKCKFFLRFMSH